MRYYLTDLIAEAEENGLRRVPDEVTNYVDFLADVEAWRAAHQERVALVTFNYDTLLDRALYSVLGWSLDTIDSYMSENDYRLFKLHGVPRAGFEPATP